MLKGDNLVSIRDLSIACGGQNPTMILDRVSLEIPHESIIALVGGSGSGKTTLGMTMLRLLPDAFRITGGNILFGGQDLATADENKMRGIRGKEIGMVFQEPMYAFNPVFTIGHQIAEVLEVHTDLDTLRRKARLLELLSLAGVDDPQRIAAAYPHQLSGGLRQRAMIAQAVAAGPQLLIADEPTSNLDVTIQARIIELFRRLRSELKLSILLITHDLGMITHAADYVAVMTGGKIVEAGPTPLIISQPQQDYTRRLMKASLV